MNSKERNVTALVPTDDRRHPAQPPEKKNGYWGRIAFRYTLMTRIVVILLLLFVILFTLMFTRVFTYDSLFSFFKDMQTVSAFVPSDYDTVFATYEAGEQQAVAYRGGIAFVNQGGVEVYSPDGNRLMAVSRTLEAPRAVASRKYLLAYDQGGKSFSVTNSYAELYHGETDFPILGAAVSASGHFALITESDRTNEAEKSVLSRVLLYDNNFNLIQEIKRATATVSVSISENGKKIAFLGATAVNGEICACLDVYRIGGKKAEQTMEFAGEMPLSMRFSGSHTMMVLTDRCLRACEDDGDVERAVELNGIPAGFTAGENGALLVLEGDNVTATNRVIAMSKSGKLLHDGAFTGDITALALGEDELFLLSGETVTRIRDGEMQTLAVEVGATDIFVTDGGEIRVIYPAKAVYLNFEA